MPDFASLVRPFATFDVTYPRRIIKVDETPPENVVLKVGDSGGGVKTLGYSRSYSLTTYMQQRQKEVEAKPDVPPDGRKRHVKRYPGKTKDASGNVSNVPGTWVDVERLEEITTQEGSGLNYQKTKTKLQWSLDADGEVPNPSRKTHTIKVPADPDNPDDLFFLIEVNDAIKVLDFDQVIKRRFDNSPENTKRRARAKVRRITHSDTPYDDDPAYEDGGIIRNYQKIPDTKDDSQNLDVEIIDSFAFDDYKLDQHFNPPQFEHWQRTLADLNNDYLIEDSDDPDKSYGEAEINPPYRLDPYQNIVNVNFLFRVYVIIVATNAFEPISDKVKVIATRSATFGRLVTVTLLECSANAGELGSLQTASDSDTFGTENIRALVTPVRAEIKNQFFEIGTSLGVVGGGGFPVDSNGFPDCPWYWYTRTLAIAPIKMSWKIRFAPHLITPIRGGTPNKMVQCYPTSGATTASSSFGGFTNIVHILGYLVVAYRLDRKATGTIYNGLVTAWTAEIFEFGTGDFPFSVGGLKFGTNPPLIAGDTPL